MKIRTPIWQLSYFLPKWDHTCHPDALRHNCINANIKICWMCNRAEEAFSPAVAGLQVAISSFILIFFFSKNVKNRPHMCTYMCLWPDGTNMTRQYKCDQMVPMWPDGTIMTKQNDISPWLQRNMWSTKVTQNDMVLEDTMVELRYWLTGLSSKVHRELIIPMWPDVTNVTICYQCDYMLSMWPNLTYVNKCCICDQMSPIWLYLTNVTTFYQLK